MWAFILVFIVVTLLSLLGLNFWQAILFGLAVTLYLTIGQTVVMLWSSLFLRFFPNEKRLKTEQYPTNKLAYHYEKQRALVTMVFLDNLIVLTIVPYLINPILILPALAGFVLSNLSDMLGAQLQGDQSALGTIFDKKF